MRLLLLVLLVVSSAYAGLEYGGLNTIVPGDTLKPSAYFGLSSPNADLYFTWTVPPAGSNTWYSFSITLAVAMGNTADLCLAIGAADGLSYATDCKSCSPLGDTFLWPQPGPWYARVTNCKAPSSTAAGVKIIALLFSAVICPGWASGPGCNLTMTPLAFNQTTEVAVGATDPPRYFVYDFDNTPGYISWVNFFHNQTYNPHVAGLNSYSAIRLDSTLFSGKTKPLDFANDFEGTEFLDVSDSWAPADYDVAAPTGRNVVTISNIAPTGSSPADHALTLLAEAIICTPPYFGEHDSTSCPYFFSDSVPVDPTQATQTLFVSGAFNPNDYHLHTGGSTHLFKFYNLTLPVTANLLYAARTSGDSVVSLGYRGVSPGYNQARSISVANPGEWVLAVTSPTNSSFEISVTIEICPDVCSKFGTCVAATSTCQCPGGYIGPICQEYALVTSGVTVTVPASSWAFYQIVVNNKALPYLYISVTLVNEPSQRVTAFASFGEPQFPIVTDDLTLLPYVFDNSTNSVTIYHPGQGGWIVAIYNAFGKEESYVIDSNIWSSPTPAPSPSPSNNGVNVVSTMVILFLGVFAFTLFVTAWVRWAAARGGYVSIR